MIDYQISGLKDRLRGFFILSRGKARGTRGGGRGLREANSCSD
jgi:hypothetical protein